eukprot:jgi/Ulvmu1/4334/UM002_0057.1
MPKGPILTAGSRGYSSSPEKESVQTTQVRSTNHCRFDNACDASISWAGAPYGSNAPVQCPAEAISVSRFYHTCRLLQSADQLSTVVHARAPALAQAYFAYIALMQCSLTHIAHAINPAL